MATNKRDPQGQQTQGTPNLNPHDPNYVEPQQASDATQASDTTATSNASQSGSGK